ncbi:MAG: FAD-dependent monooxygenase [Gemmatimonadaceae bacterium]
MDRRRHDVLVVGGGPAGAATAAFLAREGVHVCVIDRARFPRPKPCAEYLSPQAGRVLDALGVLQDVARHAVGLTGMEVRAPSGARIVGDFAAVRGFRPFHPHGLAIPRLILDELLLRRAQNAGVEVVEGERVSDLLRDRSGRVCGVRSLGAGDEERTRRARLVIGADGLRSVVARRAKLSRHLPWPRRLAFVAHYRGVTGVVSRGEMLVERDGYMGIAAVGGGESRSGTCINVSLVVDHSYVSRGHDPAARGSADLVTRWIERHPHIASRFTHAERLTPVQSTGPFAVRVRRASLPGLALVGDAADFFDPFTGEGMYSALLGGEALAHHAARALRSGIDLPLRDYDRWRRAEFAAKWRVEWVIASAVARPWLLERAARGFGMRPDLAHLLVGVTGDFVSAREVLRASYIAQLAFAAFAGGSIPVGDVTHA